MFVLKFSEPERVECYNRRPDHLKIDQADFMLEINMGPEQNHQEIMKAVIAAAGAYHGQR